MVGRDVEMAELSEAVENFQQGKIMKSHLEWSEHQIETEIEMQKRRFENELTVNLNLNPFLLDQILYHCGNPNLEIYFR